MPNFSIEKVSCPICDDVLLSPGCLPVRFSERGLELRQCLGHCLCCGRVVQLVQFLDEGNWITNKYRFSSDEAWHVFKELPEPPVLAIGPGGEYVESITVKPSRIMRAVRRLFVFIGHLIGHSNNIEHGVKA